MVSYLHSTCATRWPDVRPSGMAFVVEPDDPPSFGDVVVDLSAHPKVYAGSWGVTYDAYCTIGGLEPREQRRRLRRLGVPRERKEQRLGLMGRRLEELGFVVARRL